MRLDKLLTDLSVAGSRSQCRDLLKSGRVTVNGAPVKDGAFSVPAGARVALNGQALDTRLTRHVMLHKPAGVLTAAEDRKQKTVMDLLPPVYASLGCMPVGRLDKDTTGILLLTTDGELAHRLIAPARHVDKVYRARVDGTLDQEDAAAFAAGIPLKDFTALPARLEVVAPDTALVTVQEGKYHQVKRMFAARGKQVTALHRLRFGPLTLDEALLPGQYRELNEEETAALYAAAGMTNE
ncbi:MAG: 16S rRNA pseudouridine(516) synthase [Clostridia bacterium]|nr:16S rRNA pseudouridine(516) synthase [Clostridia bacterium]